MAWTTSSIHHKLGGRIGNVGGIGLHDVRVPVENRVGEEGDGFKIAMSALDNGRYTVASGAVGLIEACLEASVAYAKKRETFGHPIGKHQLVQQKIANMVAGRDIGRLLYYQVGWMKNQGMRLYTRGKSCEVDKLPERLPSCGRCNTDSWSARLQRRISCGTLFPQCTWGVDL